MAKRKEMKVILCGKEKVNEINIFDILDVVSLYVGEEERNA
jgi:hypothetical protein